MRIGEFVQGPRRTRVGAEKWPQAQSNSPVARSSPPWTVGQLLSLVTTAAPDRRVAHVPGSRPSDEGGGPAFNG